LSIRYVPVLNVAQFAAVAHVVLPLDGNAQDVATGVAKVLSVISWTWSCRFEQRAGLDVKELVLTSTTPAVVKVADAVSELTEIELAPDAAFAETTKF
jgi:hypothetical protein